MLRIQGMAFITNADWPELSDAWPELETEPTLTFYQNEGRKGPRKVTFNSITPVESASEDPKLTENNVQQRI